MRTLQLTYTCTALLVGCFAVRADELLPADKSLEQTIDHYVDAQLKEKNVQPASQADDATVIRRLTLDLLGRVPTVGETKAYAELKDPHKRGKLVDRLLASPAFPRHQATEFDTLMSDGGKGNMREYLLRAFQDNRSWDKIFREVMLADENDPKTKGSSAFLRQRVADLDKLTTEVSVTFFGVNVSCAQCHDHPKVEDWKQDHFYGMKSFLSRTFDNGGFLAEREYGEVKFRTTAGKEKTARMMFLTGKELVEPNAKQPSAAELKKEKDYFEELKRKKAAPKAPQFSARAQLVALSLQNGQRDFFARNVVNRLWHRFYGHGLVMPLDQMHSANPASHPELLQWLARDLVEHNYDLRRLVRGLVLSQAYARSSRWEGKDTPKPQHFGVAQIRPLTPVQLAMALRMASSDHATLETGKPDEVERRLESIEGSARGMASLFEQPGEDFQISVTEALLFSNGDRIQKELLTDGSDRLLGSLQKLKMPKEQIELAVRTVLSREPTAEEIAVLTPYLQARTDRPAEACRQMVWALMSGAEFRFNY